MRPTYLVYNNEEVEGEPDLQSFMFRFEDGTNDYVKVGHNLIGHDKGDTIVLYHYGDTERTKYEVVNSEYHYKHSPVHGDLELSFVAVDLKEVK